MKALWIIAALEVTMMRQVSKPRLAERRMKKIPLRARRKLPSEENIRFVLSLGPKPVSCDRTSITPPSTSETGRRNAAVAQNS